MQGLLGRYKYDLFAIVSLACIWLAFTFRAFERQFSYAIWLDNEFYFGPIMAKMSSLFAMKQWPFWLDTYLGGVKYYDNPQFTPYYPFYFLFTRNYENRLETIYFTHQVTLWHFLIFLITSYILLRTLSVHRVIAVAVATLIVFNENTYQLATWVTITASFAWLPLAIAGTYQVVKKPNKKSFFTLFFSLLMIVTSCPSQNLMLTIIVCFVLFTFLIFQVPRKFRADKLKELIVTGTIPLLYFSAVIIPIYLPIFLGWKGYIRWTGTGAPVIGHQKIAFEDFLSDQISLSELPNVILKTAPIHPSGSIYVGVIPVLLALIGLWYRRSDKTYIFFFGISFYALISSFGSNLGLAYLNYFIPGLNLIRQPSRFLTIFHLSLYICIALFLTWLISKPIQHKAKSHFLNFGKRHFDGISNNKITSTSLAILLVLVQFLTVPINPPKIQTSDYVTQQLSQLEGILQRIKEQDPNNKYRTVFLGSANAQRSSMFASNFGIRTVTPYFQPSPFEQFQQVYFYDLYPKEYLNSLAIKYAICGDCGDSQLPTSFQWRNNFQYSETLGKYSLFINNNVREPIRISSEILETFSSFESALNLMNSEEKLFSDNAVIAESGLAPRSRKTNDCKIISSERNGQIIEVNYFCESESTLALSEYYSPNWRIQSESADFKSFKFNGSLLGVRLKEGSHTLVISYRPEIIITLWKISFSFILILGFAHFYHRRKNLKNFK